MLIVMPDGNDLMGKNVEKINSSLRCLWISMEGREDIAYNNCQAMMSRFDKLKIKYIYSKYPGGHAWPVWRSNLYNFSQLLFK
jgi:enterochelin esterase-like enzyme